MPPIITPIPLSVSPLAKVSAPDPVRMLHDLLPVGEMRHLLDVDDDHHTAPAPQGDAGLNPTGRPRRSSAGTRRRKAKAVAA